MKRAIQEYGNFKGIRESVAIPEPNSFEDLLNLRLDRKIGGLVNRYGFQNYLALTQLLDCFTFTSFANSADTNGNQESLVIVDSTAVRVRPPVNFITGANNSTLFDITSAETNHPTIFSITQNAIVLNAPGTSINVLYDIVYNSSKGQYAVVTVYTDATHITINTGAYAGNWTAGDTLLFYQTESLYQTFSRSITGLPFLQTIDAYNNLILTGLNENVSNQSMWIGRIGSQIGVGAVGLPRTYFGATFDSILSPNACGFTYNGIYPGKISEDFTSGAFQTAFKHIETKVVPAPTTTVVIRPNRDVGSTGTHWHSEGADPPPFYTHINDNSGATYVYSNSAGDAFQVGFQPISSSTVVNRNGYVNLTITARMGSSVFGNTTGGTFLVQEIVGGSPVVRATCPVVMANGGYAGATNFNFAIPAGAFTDINKVLVQFQFTFGNTTFVLMEEYLTVDIATPTSAVITGSTNPPYAINFSLELDGFQETSLIYPNAYGLVNNATSYLESSQVSVGANNNVNLIGVKIKTLLAPLINRRCTAIKVYGGIFISGTWVWRYCQRIDMSNPSWTYDPILNLTYIEIQIGDEINSGPVYEDLNKRANNSVLQKSIVTASKPSSRTFVINGVDKQTVYYSSIANNGYETSIIPASNFIVVNDTIGDIIWLYSLGAKLFIFKRQSILTLDAYVAASSPRISVLTREHGLASPQSICSNGVEVCYVSYDGIYITAGAKSELVNAQWKEYFRITYSKAVLESSIGFYDQFSDSFYFQFRTSNTTCELWCLNVLDGEWRKEEFVVQETASGEIFGIVSYVAKSLDNRNVFSDDPRLNNGSPGSHFQMYKFPRIPVGTSADYTNQINTVNGLHEWNTHIRFKTNPVDDGGGIDVGNYIDGIFVKSNAKTTDSAVFYSSVFPSDHPTVPSTPVASVNMLIYDGNNIVKTIVFQWGRQESTVACRFPLSRFALFNEAWIKGLFFIRSFGVYYKQLLKSGNIKQLG